MNVLHNSVQIAEELSVWAWFGRSLAPCFKSFPQETLHTAICMYRYNSHTQARIHVSRYCTEIHLVLIEMKIASNKDGGQFSTIILLSRSQIHNENGQSQSWYTQENGGN